MTRSSLCVCGVLATASVAAGQAGFIVSVDYAGGLNALTPNNASCRVRVYGSFSPNDYAFAGALWNVVAAEEGWSNNILPPPINNTRGTNPGAINGAAVEGIVAGQIYFPNGGIFVNTSNPILLWQARFTATAFDRRVIDLWTLTARYDVYPYSNRPRSESRLAGFDEGRGLIRVVPAPGAVAALGVAAALAGRRRRR